MSTTVLNLYGPSPLTPEQRKRLIAELEALSSDWRALMFQPASVRFIRMPRLGRRARRRLRIKAEIAARHRAVLAKHVVWSWRDGGGAM